MTENEYKELIKRKDKLLKQYREEIELLKKQADYYRKIACTDTLTKLNNRRSLENVGKYDSVILGDIDHFKNINDKYGHTLGDQVLVEIGHILKKFVRESDLVCRWGGEEFVLLLKNCNGEDAYNKAMLLKGEVARLEEKFGFEITMSFGVSNILDKTLKTAIDEADKAMYESKEKGRDRVTIYSLNDSK